MWGHAREQTVMLHKGPGGEHGRRLPASDFPSVLVLGNQHLQKPHPGLDVLIFTVHRVHWGLIFLLHFPSCLLLKLVFKFFQQLSQATLLKLRLLLLLKQLRPGAGTGAVGR